MLKPNINKLFHNVSFLFSTMSPHCCCRPYEYGRSSYSTIMIIFLPFHYGSDGYHPDSWNKGHVHHLQRDDVTSPLL